MNLILFGFKKCGKTYYGKLLAESLHCPFIDTDRLIEELYLRKTKKAAPFKEIYKILGEESFRDLERQAIISLSGIKNTIISAGGGAVLHPDNLLHLQALGTLIYLKWTKQTLKKRLLSGELPAYFDPFDPERSFEKMYRHRLPIYESIPAITIECEGKKPDTIIAILRQHYGQ